MNEWESRVFVGEKQERENAFENAFENKRKRIIK